MSSPEQLADCHELFIPETEEARIGAVLRWVDRQPILTVSDAQSFARDGGGIALIRNDGRLQFEVNNDTLGRANLESQLADAAPGPPGVWSQPMKRSLPIRRRLALIIAVSLGVSLLLTSLFFAARQIDHRRSAKLTELRSMAEVIAFNATAVVEFQDMGAAKRFHPPRSASTRTSSRRR